MTNKDFISSLQKLCHLDSQQCTAVLNSLCRLMAQAGVEQVPVRLAGLGTFVSHKHPEYIQENPKTGQLTLYPPRITYRMQADDDSLHPDIVARQLSEQAKVTVEEAGQLIESLVQVVIEGLSHGEEVEVKGLGTFRNVISHQVDLQRVAYTPDEQMRQLVNAPFSCFEPLELKGLQAPVAAAVAEAAASSSEEQDADEGVVLGAAGLAAAAAVAHSLNETPAEEPAAAPEAAAVPEEDAQAQPEAEDVQPEPEEPIEEPLEEEAAEAPAADEEAPAEIPAAPVEEPAVEESAPVEEPAAEEPAAAEATPANVLPETPASEDADDETRKKSRRGLVLILSCLVILICGAFLLFLFHIEKGNPYLSDYLPGNHGDQPDDTPEAVVADTVATTSEAAADTLGAGTLAQNEALADTATQPGAEAAAEAPVAQPESDATEKPVEQQAPSQYLTNPDGSIKTHKLLAGERLTVIAAKYYGDKVFWPYIYDANSDHLKSPDVVNVGTVLRLPDPLYYGIDPNNPDLVQKAKVRAVQIFNQAQKKKK